jgi:hypothetical protein
MKSSSMFICSLGLALVMSMPLSAQDTLRYRLGAGISVEPALFGQTVFYSSGSGTFTMTAPLYSVSPYYVYFPVTLTRNFRVEPRFGIFSFSDEETNSLSPSQPQKNDMTLTHVGLSLEYLIPTSEKFQLYVGPRAGLNFLSSTSSQYIYSGGPGPVPVTYTFSETDFLISGIFGGEYFPMSELSIGGEIDVNYVTFGNPDQSQSPPTTGSTSTSTLTRSLFSTGALLFVRWYFL